MLPLKHMHSLIPWLYRSGLVIYTKYILMLLNIIDANQVMLWKLKENLVTECC